MKSGMPEAYKGLLENCENLERHYKDMIVQSSHLLEDDYNCHHYNIHYLLDFIYGTPVYNNKSQDQRSCVEVLNPET